MKLGLLCRCKDEYFIEEFVRYYINEGVDHIYIIDDNSNNKTIYQNLHCCSKVSIIYAQNIISTDFANKLYKDIRSNYDWMIYVDADEFITTKKNPNRTVREELKTTFKDVDCVKIPWVMMSCNNIYNSPNSILISNIYRWNHDLKHINKISHHYKFRCRYQKIEVKCIFKPKYFEGIWDHHPKTPIKNKILKVCNSITNESSELDSFYDNLREKSIANGYLLCYHYRIISIQNCEKKLLTNEWYIKNGYNLTDLMSTDYPELIDLTLATKSTKSRIITREKTSNFINKFN